ncbi:MAG: CDP-alcohol phosphatidyltransferase family protein [Actinomycetota bacterium]|nr:CDP-alcohol phosphatidyltransferase family protein [Actinomycetota bacterium]
MLNARIRRGWDRMMRPVGSRLGSLGLSANLITLLNVVVQVVVAYLIIEGRLLAAGLVAIVSALGDTLDGAVAKAQGTATPFGALLDSTTDRLSDALFFVPVAWLYGVSPGPEQADQAWVAALALIALVASFLVSYVKARAEGLGFECNVGIAERAERLILMIVGLILSFMLPTVLAILALLSIITVFQRMFHVRGQIKSAA